MTQIINQLLYSPFFGIALTMGAYALGVYINKKTKLIVLNPLVVAAIIIMVLLSVLNIDYYAYETGADYIAVLLVPATVCLAIPVYKKISVLKENILPVVIGCAVGAAVAITSVYILCNLFGLTDTLTKSLLPKSVTSAFGMVISQNLGGIPSVTIICILLTGIMGVLLSPFMIKIFRVKNPVARGLAIGASSHALGTTKALELGETEGALSSIAVAITGCITAVYALLFI